jgi:hypothetical protein
MKGSMGGAVVEKRGSWRHLPFNSFDGINERVIQKDARCEKQ